MRALQALLLRYRYLTFIFVAFTVAYIWQSLATQPSKASLQKYHLTSGRLHEIVLTFAIPYIVIWFAGLIGYLWLKSYTSLLGKSKDGRAFRTISRAVFLLVVWLPVNALASGVASNYYADHPSSTANMVRLINYLSIFILLPAFYLLSKGSGQLVKITRIKEQTPSNKMNLIYIALAPFYVFLTLHDPARQFPTETLKVASYYLPDWLTILTIVIPRLLMWYLGVQAVANIILYKRKVSGEIYKQGLHYLALGLSYVIAMTISIRIIQSVSVSLQQWNLGFILLLIYALLILMGVGYGLVARGAKRLQKIEEL